jgi:hypothetical protein
VTADYDTSKHFYSNKVNLMNRIAFSLASAALLSVAAVPMAQAAPHLNGTGGLHPAILNQAQVATPDVEPSGQTQSIPALEQRHLNRLDRTGNAPSALNSNQPQTTASDDLDPHNIASVSPLQRMRLNHLNTSN